MLIGISVSLDASHHVLRLEEGSLPGMAVSDLKARLEALLGISAAAMCLHDTADPRGATLDDGAAVTSLGLREGSCIGLRVQDAELEVKYRQRRISLLSFTVPKEKAGAESNLLVKVHEGQDVAQLANEIGAQHKLGSALTEAIAQQIRCDPGHDAPVQQSADRMTLMRFDGSDSAALLEALQATLDQREQQQEEAADTALALQYLHELRRLSRDGVRRLEALEDGAVELVVRAMRAFPSHVPLQSAAVAVLHNLCHVVDRHDAYCDHLPFAQGAAQQAGGVGAVLHTLATHGDEIELLTLSLRTLCNLCHAHVPNQAETRSGAGTLIPKLLFAHSDDEKLAAEALRAIFSVYHSASSDGCSDVLAAGALSAAVLAMDMHAEHAGVQLSGLLALYALMGEAPARREAHRSGVLRIIGSTLDVHIEHEEVLRQALRLLSLFCHGDEARKTAAVHIGAINAVLNAMEHKPNDQHAQLQVAGLEALFNLCNHDEANQAALAVSGGVASVVGAMRRHPGNGEPSVEAQVQEAGMRLLFLLSCNVGVHHMLQNSDAKRAVLAVREHFPHDFYDSFGPAVLQNLESVKKGRADW